MVHKVVEFVKHMFSRLTWIVIGRCWLINRVGRISDDPYLSDVDQANRIAEDRC
jgi:hypothetical protein